MKTSIKSVIVLTLICLVVSGILAGINFFTGPIIKEYESRVAYEACYKVMPDASTFEEVHVDNLPKTVTNVYKETTGKGYVFKMDIVVVLLLCVELLQMEKLPRLQQYLVMKLQVLVAKLRKILILINILVKIHH